MHDRVAPIVDELLRTLCRLRSDTHGSGGYNFDWRSRSVPDEDALVHNVNLLGASFLLRAGRLTGEPLGRGRTRDANDDHPVVIVPTELRFMNGHGPSRAPPRRDRDTGRLGRDSGVGAQSWITPAHASSKALSARNIHACDHRV